jgi:hypothetical protein
MSLISPTLELIDFRYLYLTDKVLRYVFIIRENISFFRLRNVQICSDIVFTIYRRSPNYLSLQVVLLFNCMDYEIGRICNNSISRRGSQFSLNLGTQTMDLRQLRWIS